MTRFGNPLKNLKVAAPCPVEWNSMDGDDRVRFCGQCRLNVFNLSAMTEVEAVNLLESKQGRLCVRYFRRADGTVLTQDCPVGLAALRAKVRRWTAFVFACLVGGLSACGLKRSCGVKPAEIRGEALMGSPVSPGNPPENPREIMGDVAYPAPPPPPEAGR